MSHNLALALSGGGFRATLFHLGVIAALRDCGALRHVKKISAVSGGSLMAAHLVLNWTEYSSDPADDRDFRRAAKRLIRFVGRDVRGRILRRWIGGTPVRVACALGRRVPMNPNRWLATRLDRCRQRRTPTGLLRDYLEDLFAERGLKELQVEDAPEVAILTTNLNTLGMAFFDRTGFHPELGAEPFGGDRLTVGFAVAASMAFPGYFPPQELIAPGDKPPYYLSDGGIYDNLGVEFFLDGAADQPEYLLISDASVRQNPTENRKITNGLFTSIRAVDVLLDRSKQLSEEKLREPLSQSAWVSISQQIELGDVPSAIRSDYQPEVSRLRTDLDGFSKLEVEALVRHGYACCQSILCNDPGAHRFEWDQSSFRGDLGWLGTRCVSAKVPKEVEATLKRLRSGAARKYFLTPSLLKDFYTLWLLAVSCGLFEFFSFALAWHEGRSDEWIKDVKTELWCRPLLAMWESLQPWFTGVVELLSEWYRQTLGT